MTNAPNDGNIKYTIRMHCSECIVKGIHVVKLFVRAAPDGHVAAECPKCHHFEGLYCPRYGLLFDPKKASDDAHGKIN